MFIITHDTLVNPGILETRSLPKKFLGRVMVIPARAAGRGIWWRVIFEMQVLRYLVALVPFIVAMLVWPRLALPISQAPVLMIAAIALFEMRVLRVKPSDRAGLVTDDEAARVLDLLGFRARDALAQIAARKDLSQGRLRLVVEQSEMARIAPLTLVTVQSDMPGPHVLALDAGDRAVLADLFDATLTEPALALVNQAQNTFLRDIAFETRGVSAHARLAAALDKRGASLPAVPPQARSS